MTPIQVSKQINEKKVLHNLQDKRRKQKPKIKLGGLVRTADIEKISLKVILQIGVISYTR